MLDPSNGNVASIAKKPAVVFGLGCFVAVINHEPLKFSLNDKGLWFLAKVANVVLGFENILIFLNCHVVAAQPMAKMLIGSASLAIGIEMVALSPVHVKLVNWPVLFAALASLYAISSGNRCRRCIMFAALCGSLGNALLAGSIKAVEIMGIASKVIGRLNLFASSTAFRFWKYDLPALHSSLAKIFKSLGYAGFAIRAYAIRSLLCSVEVVNGLRDMTCGAFLQAINGYRHWKPLSGLLMRFQGPIAEKAATTYGYAYRPWNNEIICLAGGIA
jgi:hypothetical protein